MVGFTRLADPARLQATDGLLCPAPWAATSPESLGPSARAFGAPELVTTAWQLLPRFDVITSVAVTGARPVFFRISTYRTAEAAESTLMRRVTWMPERLAPRTYSLPSAVICGWEALNCRPFTVRRIAPSKQSFVPSFTWPLWLMSQRNPRASVL